jgi:hypothetical protein
MVHGEEFPLICREKAHPPSLKLWRTRNAHRGEAKTKAELTTKNA